MHFGIRSAAFAAFLAISAGASGQNIHPEKQASYSELVARKVPVSEGDIVDRPYRVLAEIEANARQVTRFSKRPSDTKLAAELWDEARKIGADAVLHAQYGDLETTGLTYGQRRATGQAVKFLSEAEAAQWRASNTD